MCGLSGDLLSSRPPSFAKERGVACFLDQGFAGCFSLVEGETGLVWEEVKNKKQHYSLDSHPSSHHTDQSQSLLAYLEQSTSTLSYPW